MYGFSAFSFLLVLGSSLAQVPVNMTHIQIQTSVDNSFQFVDHDHDGFVHYDEFEAAWFQVDTNNDHKVSEAEYIKVGTNQVFSTMVFQEMDYDGDGYVDRSAIMGEYSVMDTNADNNVSRFEFDNYFTSLVELAIKNHGYLLG